MLETSVLKHIAKLQQKKYRKEYGEFFVEGVKGVEEALGSEFEVIAVIVDSNVREEDKIQKIIRLAEEIEVDVLFASGKDIDAIKSTETFPGIMAIVEIPETSLNDLDMENHIIALDEITDPGNLGTIIRTADWFGITNILLGPGCVELYNEKVVRSTMGSVFHEIVVFTHDLQKSLEELREEEYTIASLELQGESLEKMDKKKKYVFVFGSESHGVSEGIQEQVDVRYTIPGKGQAESLNVAIAAGIVMKEIS
ncbi:MAG: RNA methyltransferase [Candidatus Magasanikbacteria bacterium]